MICFTTAELRDAAAVLEVDIPPPRTRARLFDVPIPHGPPREATPGSLDRALGRASRKRIAHLIYVVRSAPFVKIGTSSDVEARFRALLAMNPHPLEMVAIFQGDVQIERSLHRRFGAFRHRDEWFRKEGALARWIRAGCPRGDRGDA